MGLRGWARLTRGLCGTRLHLLRRPAGLLWTCLLGACLLRTGLLGACLLRTSLLRAGLLRANLLRACLLGSCFLRASLLLRTRGHIALRLSALCTVFHGALRRSMLGRCSVVLLPVWGGVLLRWPGVIALGSWSSVALFHGWRALLHVVVAVLCHGCALLFGVLLLLADGGGWRSDAAAPYRSSRGCLRGLAMVGGVELLVVAGGGLLGLTLFRKRSRMGEAHRCDLGGTRTDVHATMATVIAGAILDTAGVPDVVVFDRVVVGIAGVTVVGNGAVVVEVVAVPIAT